MHMLIILAAVNLLGLGGLSLDAFYRERRFITFINTQKVHVNHQLDLSDEQNRKNTQRILVSLEEQASTILTAVCAVHTDFQEEAKQFRAQAEILKAHKKDLEDRARVEQTNPRRVVTRG